MIFEHELTKVKLSDLTFDKTNPNIMNKEQMAGLRKAMERFGYLSPIVVDQNNQIADGEHRVLVYKEFNIQEIPCYRVTFSDDSERRLLRQTMNKLRGQHDFAMDADEMALLYEANKLPDLSGLIAQQEATLKELMLKYKPDLPFGHEDDEQIDQIIDEQLKKTAPDTQLGDIYQLGNHRLICADCTDKRSIDRLFDGKKAKLIFSDPPYGVGYRQDKYGNHMAKYNLFEELENDSRDPKQYYDFIRSSFETLIKYIHKGTPVYLFAAPLVNGQMSLEALRDLGFHMQSQIIWVKPWLILSRSDYHWRHEIMWYGYYGNPHYWCGDRKQSTIWEINKDIGTTEYKHPTQKPVELATRALHNSSRPDDIILDPFLGSGSTLIACEQTGRICYGCEIDPHYCDVIVKRWEAYTGQKSIRL